MGTTETFKQQILQLGADLVGIADATPLRALRTDPDNLLAPYSRAIAIAVRVPTDVFETIQDRPTPIYATAYQASNRILDEIALKAANQLQRAGHSALPIPAAQILDRKHWYGAISHKAVARMAGLGWQGKNLLLITPEFGSRVRLVTLLTDAPLAIDEPIENRCGKCRLCVDACPVDAIHNVNTNTHYDSREEAIDLQRCAEKVTVEFANLPNIGAPMCGICIKVCPFGRRTKPPPST